MPGIDLFNYPISKRLPYDGMNDVGNVLARHLDQLLLDLWQSISYLRVALGELEEAFDGETFELGNRYMKNIFTLDDGLGTSRQISHMEDCDVVIWRQVCTAIIS